MAPLTSRPLAVVLILFGLLAPLLAQLPLRVAAPIFGLYREDIVPQQWIETGTHFNLTGDDFAKDYTLPFTFNFYGTNYTSIWISTNGLISFTGPDISFNNPVDFATKTVIAPLWDDLRTDCNNNPACSQYNDTDVYIDLPDANHVLIRWKAVAYANTGVVVNFEAIMGSDSVIRLNYGPSNGNVTATAGISNGSTDAFSHELTYSNNRDSFLYTPISGNRPVIIYTTSPSQPWLLGETVSFNASASYDPDGFITSYKWDFGDNTTVLTPTATHIYTTPGEYSVTLTVTDNSTLRSVASFMAKVSSADARLLDTWSDVGVLHLASGRNITLGASAINIGSLPVTVKIDFQIVNLKLGNATLLSSQTGPLASREEVVLNATFTAPTMSAKYTVLVTIYFTPRDPASSQPGWITTGTFYLKFRVAR